MTERNGQMAMIHVDCKSRSKVVMFTPRFRQRFAARRARRSSPESTLEVDIQLKNLRSVGDGTGNFCEWAGTAGGERGREAQRGSAAGSYCAAGLKTH